MRLIFHNAPHDIPIIAEMFGCTAEQLMRRWRELGIVVDDTMMKAFVLRLLPQGLKPLGARFTGTLRPSYPDIIAPADRAIAICYLERILENECKNCDGTGSVIVQPTHKSSGKLLDPRPVNCPECEGDGTAWPPPDETLEWDSKKGRLYLSRGHRMGSRVRSILDARDNIDPKTDKLINLRARWEKGVDYEFRLKVEDSIGPMPEASLNDVEPQKDATDYSAGDADFTIRIDRELDRLLDSDPGHRIPDGLRRVYNIDNACRPLLIRMMEVGTYVDCDRLRALDEKLENDANILLYRIEKEVGHYVNPSSPKQVGEILFDQLQLPVIAETKTGDESTGDKVLEDLKLWTAAQPNSPLNEKRLRFLTYTTDYRECETLRTRYTIALPRQVDKASRVHTTFKDTRTATDRLSSADPNLQNIPNPEKFPSHVPKDCNCHGCWIRGSFTVPAGYSMVSLDYSQIEVRVMAHESGDPTLIEAIRKGLDVHLVTASRIFRKPLHKKGCECGKCPTKKERAISKNITFLILYGGGAPRLKAELKLKGIEVTEAEAQALIDAYFDAYPDIEAFMWAKVAEAKKYGYVEDMFGWRRYLPGVDSDLAGVKSEAERQAINTTIQSGAAHIMKLGMPIIFWEVLPYIRKQGYKCDPLLTVHDEFVFEVQHGGEQLLIDAAREAMLREVSLAVPVTVDGAAGDRWSTCH